MSYLVANNKVDNIECSIMKQMLRIYNVDCDRSNKFNTLEVFYWMMFELYARIK